MTLLYTGGNPFFSTAGTGVPRVERVEATRANELVLSGSPLAAFVSDDYRNITSYRIDAGEVYQKSVAGIYNRTTTTWLLASQTVTVDKQGLKITLDGGVSIGDICDIWYYASGFGFGESDMAMQTGDQYFAEVLDAFVQSLNDQPPLNWGDPEPSGVVFDEMLAFNTTATWTAGSWVTVLDYNAPTGTWNTSDEPFYLTALWLTWDGDDIYDSVDSELSVRMYIDGNASIQVDYRFAEIVTLFTDSKNDRYYAHTVYKPSSLYTGTYTWSKDEAALVPLGLLKIRSDIQVDVMVDAGMTVSNECATLSGWCV